jgi:uncharacterized membrane protein YkvA (DUF1232 family)
MTDEESNEYQEAFSERRFSQKLSRYAKAAGREVVEKALLLYYTLRDDKAPAWARATITGALGYFIVPLDAIADFTPAVGYADDLGVLALAVAVVAAHIDEEVREKAAARVRQWFGADGEDGGEG